MDYDNISGNWGVHTEVGNNIYLCTERYNAIIQADVNTGKGRIIGAIPNENLCLEFLYWKIVTWKNKLFLIPCNAKEIAVLDLQNLEIRKVHNTEIMKKVEGLSCKYSSYYKNENTLILIPEQMPLIVEIDMESETITKAVSLDLGQKGGDKWYCTANDNYVKGNRLYAVCRENPAVIEYDISCHKVTKFEIPQVITGFTCMVGCGEKIYMLSNKHELVIWNIDSKCVEKVNKIDELDSLREDMRRGTVVGHKVVFLDVRFHKMVTYDIADCKMEVNDSVLKPLDQSGENYTLAEVDGENIYAYSNHDRCIKYNLKEHRYVYNNRLLLQEQDVYKYFQNMQSGPKQEALPDMLPRLIRLLKDDSNKELGDIERDNKKVGSIIYNNCKGL